MLGGSDMRSPGKMETGPLVVLVHWFQTILTNLNVEMQKQALNACWETASSVLATKWYDEEESDVAKAAPV